jgi:hypothetical protein
VELAVNDAVGASQATVSSELRDIRRILADDMEAANEATAVFGRLLAKLGDRLEVIEGTLRRLDEIENLVRRLEARLDSQQAAPPAPAAPPTAPPARRSGKSGSAPATPAPATPAPADPAPATPAPATPAPADPAAGRRSGADPDARA